jgi:mannitol/fructose-specific phosphotransferase system IIA component (Ntr-type)
VVAKAVVNGLRAHDKGDAIRQLVAALVGSGELAPGEQAALVSAVLAREALGSTALGRGVAIPHAQHPSVPRTMGSVAVTADGVDFQSLDGGRTHIFFLLLSPLGQSPLHTQALERIASQTRDDVFCRLLRQCATVDEIRLLLDEADERHTVRLDRPDASPGSSSVAPPRARFRPVASGRSAVRPRG